MRNLVRWVIGIALFCWGVCSAFSIFSELKFLVDGWSRLVDQAPISIHTTLLLVGKWAAALVEDYRAFVHGLVEILHLPRLPQFVYDAIGLVTLSIGRGSQLGWKAASNWRQHLSRLEETSRDLSESLAPERFSGKARRLWEHKQRLNRNFPIMRRAVRLRYAFDDSILGSDARGVFKQTVSTLVFFPIAVTLVYGGLVSLLLATLFALDYVYRHFT